MSYAVAPPTQTPPPSPPPSAPPRRPVTVQLAAVLLAVMALAGLGYAIVTLAVTPGVIDRFRADAGGAGSGDLDGYVTVVWMFAALGTVLAVILFALYTVLALALRRGSNGARIATWVVCGLGMLFGCGSAVAVGVQRSGDGTPGTLGFALSEAYPESWIGVNVSLAIAQILGYAVVALLLVLSPKAFFRKPADESARPQSYVALPTYGSANAFAQQPQSAPPAQQPGGYDAQQAGYGAHAPAQQGYAGQPPVDLNGYAAQPSGAQPSAAFPSAPAPTAEDHAMWSRPSAEPPAAPPTSPAAPSSGGAEPPASSSQALSGEVAPSGGQGQPPGGLPASASLDEGTDTIPTVASAPTPMAPPYYEPSHHSVESAPNDDENGPGPSVKG